MKSKIGYIEKPDKATAENSKAFGKTQSTPERIGDQIIYLVVTYNKDGAHTQNAAWNLQRATDLCDRYYGAEIISQVVNMEQAREQALAKLDGLDRLVLGL